MESQKREQILTSFLNDQECHLVYSREEAENMLKSDIEKHLVAKINGDTAALRDAIYVLENNLSTEDYVHNHHIYTKNNPNDFFMQSQIDEVERALSLIQDFQLSAVKWYFKMPLNDQEELEVEKELLYRRSLKVDDSPERTELTILQ